ncbi:MAG TPA: hypothetical protein VIC04_03835, partial [Terriglobia bacterium]
LYHFMVNGQTGEVQGQAPVDWVKVAIVVVIVLAILAVVAFFVLSQQSSDGSSQSLLIIQHVALMLQAPLGFAHWAAAPPLLL